MVYLPFRFPYRMSPNNLLYISTLLSLIALTSTGID